MSIFQLKIDLRRSEVYPVFVNSNGMWMINQQIRIRTEIFSRWGLDTNEHPPGYVNITDGLIKTSQSDKIF